MYKPGNMSAPPPFLTPHQPRLDWQMWFAALGPNHQSPWFSSLLYRLLQGKKDGECVCVCVCVCMDMDMDMGPYHQSPWFTSLLYRLLQGKKDGVCV